MAALLQSAREQGGLVISAPVHAELQAYPEATARFIERFLRDTGVRVDFSMSDTVWLGAGEAYAAYAERRRNAGGGYPKRLLVDFIIGSHAFHQADRLLTLDPKRYQTSFPELCLSPNSDV